MLRTDIAYICLYRSQQTSRSLRSWSGTTNDTDSGLWTGLNARYGIPPINAVDSLLNSSGAAPLTKEKSNAGKVTMEKSGFIWKNSLSTKSISWSSMLIFIPVIFQITVKPSCQNIQRCRCQRPETSWRGGLLRCNE